ncbi:hypothetical protein ACQR16_13545 [Bradyrhizobium oligotrophicum]|uniref:hypothetical protein n=1 Tax=Bradyrhizobium oligotrophicum TaxID=44255 RepID=UPI003EBB66B9
MNLYTLKSFSNATSDLANALSDDDQDALNQAMAQLRRKDADHPQLKLSSDPQSKYFMEKRAGIPSSHGRGWMNDPRGVVEIVYVDTQQ